MYVAFCVPFVVLYGVWANGFAGMSHKVFSAMPCRCYCCCCCSQRKFSGIDGVRLLAAGAVILFLTFCIFNFFELYGGHSFTKVRAPNTARDLQHFLCMHTYIRTYIIIHLHI